MTGLHNYTKIFDRDIRNKNIKSIGRQLRGLYWELTQPQMRDPIFVIGCSRSGTTVTYETISASKQLISFGYELPQFWNGLYGPLQNGWDSEAADESNAKPDHREKSFRYMYSHIGKGWVVDKTCINVMRVRYLNSMFPEARFVFIQRDGRDNISSLMDGWRQDGHFGLTQFLGASPDPVGIENNEFTEWSFFLPPGWREYNHSSLEEVCAYQWVTSNQLALESKKHIAPDRWIQLRYEDIFTRPIDMFREVFERLELDFTPELRERCASLANRPTSIVKGMPKISKWKENNPDAVERVMPMIKPMMEKLGYGMES